MVAVVVGTVVVGAGVVGVHGDGFRGLVVVPFEEHGRGLHRIDPHADVLLLGGIVTGLAAALERLALEFGLELVDLPERSQHGDGADALRDRGRRVGSRPELDVGVPGADVLLEQLDLRPRRGRLLGAGDRGEDERKCDEEPLGHGLLRAGRSA